MFFTSIMFQTLFFNRQNHHVSSSRILTLSGEEEEDFYSSYRDDDSIDNASHHHILAYYKGSLIKELNYSRTLHQYMLIMKVFVVLRCQRVAPITIQ